MDVRATDGSEPGLEYNLAIRLPAGGEPVRSDLKVTGSVWSPGLYVPTLRAVFARLQVTPSAAGADGALPDADLLKALARPLTAEIEARNQQISTWLQEHPLDAHAHEQAALLLGTLAMRENAGLFWDPRGLCNRAAAHLAMARTLRSEPSESGEVAELLLGLLIDTKADCQHRIAALQARVAAHPELGPWARAAALRNTRDYRLPADPGTATLLERVERFRALSEAISAEQAIARTPKDEPDTAPDWSRIILQAGYGVSAGHQFALPSIGLELKDGAAVFPELAEARTADAFAAVYNQMPGGAVASGEDHRAHWQVIDRGTWARFFQRHLLQAADETYDFLQDKWGVPDEAKQFRAQIAPLVKPLTLYPLCLEHLGREDRSGIGSRAADLLNQHPEWVSDRAWSAAVNHLPAPPGRNAGWQSDSLAWFSPRLPTGTVYGYDWRASQGKILPPPVLDELQKYHDIAPLKYSVCWDYLKAAAPDHHPKAEQCRAVMGPLRDYYLPAIRAMAYFVQNDPAQYGPLMNQAAALNPNDYLSLGSYYLDHHLEPEAARAYQAAIDHEADPVTLSNSCYWLTHYYYDHGQPDRAMKVAQQMAEVYSSKGLETLASLLETMGRDDEAESSYQKIQERYGNAGPLLGFYSREGGKNPVYAQKLKAAEHEVFPQGIETVTLSQLSNEPDNGVLVHGDNEVAHRSGLRAGAIIVGLDGRRVHNLEQYYYVRALTAAPEMDLLVYQNNRYQEIHANVPGRQFRLDFSTWP